MHQRIRQHVLLVVVAVGLTVGAWSTRPSSAHAYHTYETRLLDTTAYSLDRREARLGLMKLSYGIFDQLQVSTYTIPWLLGLILEDIAPNLELKSTFYNHRKLALSANFGFIIGGVEQVQWEQNDQGMWEENTTNVNYSIVPAGLASSIRFNHWVSLHLGGQFTWTETFGGSQPADTDIRGAAAINLLQIYGMAEWRLSKVTAFTLTVRWVPYVSNIVLKSNVQIDPNTGAIIQVEVEIVDLRNSFAIIPGFVFSWERANLRLGVGYGDVFVESMGGLVIPGSALTYLSPELDVFVRF